MARGDRIPPSDHVVRLCKFTHLDEETGLPTGNAFYPKSDEEHLSVNWLEYFQLDDEAEAVGKIRECFINKDYSLGGQAKFSVLNIGELEECANAFAALKVLHWPIDAGQSEPEDPSHSGVFGYPDELHTRQLVGDIIAETHSFNTYPAKG